jgi:integrase
MTKDVWLRLAFNLAVGTGIRAGELLALRWKDIDFNKQQLHVRGETTKNNKPRTVFMGTKLCQLFRKIERSECWIPIERVFPGSFSYYHLHTSAKRLSNHVDAFVWHDLRHTYAVHCVKNGMDLPTLAKLLGHKSTKVTERYANFAPTHEHVRKCTPNF